MLIHMFTIFGSLAQAAMLDYVVDSVAKYEAIAVAAIREL